MIEDFESENSVYSKNAVEFITVANEYCRLLESTDDLLPKDFATKVQKLLTLLYLKSTLLPDLEIDNDSEVEKFVTEHDWLILKEIIANKLGEHDLFIDVLDNI